MTMSEAHKGIAKPEKNTHGQNAQSAPTARRGNAHSTIGFFDTVYGQQKKGATAFFDLVYRKRGLGDKSAPQQTVISE